MTISTLLMILAFAVGPGTSWSIESNSTTYLTGTAKIANHCWINGVWYNPCPSEPSSSSRELTPEIALP